MTTIRKSLRYLLTLALLSLLFLQMAAQIAIDTGNFKNPPNEYRITQYGLTPETLKRYPQYGIGGTMAFFYSILYPESGRENFRLADNGPEIVNDLVDSAKAINYKVWLADDWGYPSGMAGGRVVAENPDWEVKGLTMLTVSGKAGEAINYALPADLYDIIYAIIYPLKAGVADLTAGQKMLVDGRNVNKKQLKTDWELRIFARYVRNKDVQAQSTMQQFGHTGRYPDLMNHDAISRFIANMHKPILDQIDNASNKVEGFYTNEPNLMQTHWQWEPDAPYACVPWSDGLPDQFKKMFGYDLFDVLPSLFEGNSDKDRRARLHYRQTVTWLLTNSFARQIREWCNARDIKSSGHFLLNEYLSMHAQGYGDLMKFVSEFDVPALDIPIPNPDEFMDFPYQQTRFFSSVASWKKRDMTIMLLDPIIGGYGLTRLSPDLPLLINSVNMASFHGANLFTSYLPLDPRQGPDGIANGYSKEEFNFLNEYTGRLTQVLRGAKREAGVGLYYPIAMFQADLIASNKFWSKMVDLYTERQHKWDTIEKALMSGDVEYLIVHPEAVAEAQIKDGKMQIGFGSFHTMVMPQLDYIPLAVSENLKRFEESGGKVIWVDQVPYGAEQCQNDRKVLKNLKHAQIVKVNELSALIKNSYSPEFDLTFTPGTDQLTIGRFYKNDAQVYLLVNRLQQDITVDVDGQLAHKTGAKIKLLNPSTGEISDIPLPSILKLEANRSLMLIPESEYLAQPLK